MDGQETLLRLINRLEREKRELRDEVAGLTQRLEAAEAEAHLLRRELVDGMIDVLPEI